MERFSLFVLLILGIVVFFVWFNEVIYFEIDTQQKRLLWMRRNRFGSRLRVIPWTLIDRILIRKVGREGRGIVYYFLGVRLKSGEILITQDKFSDRREAQIQADLLGQQMGVESDQMKFFDLTQNQLVLISLITATVGYVVYYQLTVGPLCFAMWLGAFPIFFLSSIGVPVYFSLKRLRISD